MKLRYGLLSGNSLFTGRPRSSDYHPRKLSQFHLSFIYFYSMFRKFDFSDKIATIEWISKKTVVWKPFPTAMICTAIVDFVSCNLQKSWKGLILMRHAVGDTQRAIHSAVQCLLKCETSRDMIRHRHCDETDL